MHFRSEMSRAWPLRHARSLFTAPSRKALRSLPLPPDIGPPLTQEQVVTVRDWAHASGAFGLTAELWLDGGAPRVAIVYGPDGLMPHVFVYRDAVGTFCVLEETGERRSAPTIEAALGQVLSWPAAGARDGGSAGVLPRRAGLLRRWWRGDAALRGGASFGAHAAGSEARRGVEASAAPPAAAAHHDGEVNLGADGVYEPDDGDASGPEAGKLTATTAVAADRPLRHAGLQHELLIRCMRFQALHRAWLRIVESSEGDEDVGGGAVLQAPWIAELRFICRLPATDRHGLLAKIRVVAALQAWMDPTDADLGELMASLQRDGAEFSTSHTASESGSLPAWCRSLDWLSRTPPRAD